MELNHCVKRLELCDGWRCLML